MRALTPLLFVAALLCAAPLHALKVPALTGYVNDYANMISAATKQQLEQQLGEFEKSDSTQVVILTVDSLEGDTIEDFGIRVGDEWKIGQAKKDNGIIFLISKSDRMMRIEVGRGLEGVMTDLISGRIIDNIIRPEFKAGNFDGGVIAGVKAIVEVCRGEFKNDGKSTKVVKAGSLSKYSILFLIIVYFLVVGLSSISKLLGGGVGALALPAIIHFAISPIGIIGAIITAIVGFILALIIPYIPIGGGGGYSSGSGGGGGGGFSGGGGGSFGGGGSSGGW